MIDEGACGKVHKCKDLRDSMRNLVVKMSTEVDLMRKEIDALKDINYFNRHSNSQFVYLVKSGQIVL